MPQSVGKVYLVGAGPGDPELITLRGCELLRRADVVVYDYLVNPLVLRHTSVAAEKICLGSHRQGRILPQEEINRRVISAAQAGKTVVRLKGGDPSIFGRVSEEVAAIEEARVPYELVPGVTTALAASSHAGIPLTHRAFASSVAFVTGRECHEKKRTALDFENLARFPGTLVFYMGVTTAPDWATELVAHGKPAHTPVAVVRHCSLPTQRTHRTTLGELPELLARLQVRPPAIIIVGDVVSAQAQVNEFTSRPLFGQSVLVTRAEQQSTSLMLRIGELGAAALAQAAIQIGPALEPGPLDKAIRALAEFNWLVFSSANGVKFFMERLLQLGGDLRRLGSCQLAAIGPATVAELGKYHLRADLQPEKYQAEALAAKLVPAAGGQRVLLVRASRGREVLAESLRAAGITVEQVVAYESNDVSSPDPSIVAALAAGQINWITITSSAIARSLVAMFGEQLRRARLAAISPLTAGILAEAGFPPDVIAREYSTEGLLQAIVEACD